MMENQPYFTPDSLKEFLDNRKGATFIGLFARSLLDMNKTGNPYFEKVVHEWGRNVVFGANYQNSVNRRWTEAAPEDTEYFFAEKLWHGHGERINHYMARHKKEGTEYLVYQLRTDSEGKTLPHLYERYVHADTGDEISLETLRPWMKAKTPSKKQRVLELGCRETFPRTVKIYGGWAGKFQLGVKQITIDGDEYQIIVPQAA